MCECNCHDVEVELILVPKKKTDIKTEKQELIPKKKGFLSKVKDKYKAQAETKTKSDNNKNTITQQPDIKRPSVNTSTLKSDYALKYENIGNIKTENTKAFGAKENEVNIEQYKPLIKFKKNKTNKTSNKNTNKQLNESKMNTSSFNLSRNKSNISFTSSHSQNSNSFITTYKNVFDKLKLRDFSSMNANVSHLSESVMNDSISKSNVMSIDKMKYLNENKDSKKLEQVQDQESKCIR